tara:strand:+ start:1937 stop:2128 length:192 start_codon:yes stop_codon:yes gene_type:complete
MINNCVKVLNKTIDANNTVEITIRCQAGLEDEIYKIMSCDAYFSDYYVTVNEDTKTIKIQMEK